MRTGTQLRDARAGKTGLGNQQKNNVAAYKVRGAKRRWKKKTHRKDAAIGLEKQGATLLKIPRPLTCFTVLHCIMALLAGFGGSVDSRLKSA